MTISAWRTADPGTAFTPQARARLQCLRAGGSGHAGASAAHRARPFHHESIFIRLRPYRSAGAWDGRDPLAGLALPGAAERKT